MAQCEWGPAPKLLRGSSRRHPALLAATVVIPLPAPRALGSVGYRWGERRSVLSSGVPTRSSGSHGLRAAGWAAWASLPSCWSLVLPRGGRTRLCHPGPSLALGSPPCGPSSVTLLRKRASCRSRPFCVPSAERRVGAPSDLHVWAVSPVPAASPSLLARSGPCFSVSS